MIKPFQSKALNYGKKNIASIVVRQMSKGSAKHQKINSVFGVMPAIKALFIKELITSAFAKDAGLSSGSKKATLLDDFLSSLVTAILRLNKSKIIGSISHLNSIPILPMSNMSFMTGLISAKTAVLSHS